METALNVYEILMAVNRAMGQLDDDALREWQTKNAALWAQALDIQRVRDELESDG